ncbi:MAG: response regulator [Verrucomicrobiota bacterium]
MRGTVTMNSPVDTGVPSEERPAPLIFIVDDEPMVCQVVDFCLRSAGYQTRIFHDPQLALDAFIDAMRKPDLLLTDFQMPGMNGLELIERCKALHPPLKTISISGTLQVYEIEGIGTKPDRFIPKPFFPKELLDPVRVLLGS